MQFFCQGSLCFTLFGTSIVSCLLRCSELAASACRPWIFARSLLPSFRSASDGLVDHQLILPNYNLSGSVQLTLHSRWSCYCLTGFPFVRLAIYVLTRALVFPPATNGFCNFEAPGRRTAAFINTQVGAEVSGQGQLEDWLFPAPSSLPGTFSENPPRTTPELWAKTTENTSSKNCDSLSLSHGVCAPQIRIRLRLAGHCLVARRSNWRPLRRKAPQWLTTANGFRRFYSLCLKLNKQYLNLS